MAECDVVVWRIRKLVVKRGPEPLCALEIFVDEKAEYMWVREAVLAGHYFEYLLNHFCMSELMLWGV
jgi:hypothetical protein